MKFNSSSFNAEEKIKYSGVLNEYPWLDEVLEIIQKDSDSNKEDEGYENLYRIADMLLQEIVNLLENDNGKKSYKSLKSSLLALIQESYWEN